MTPKEKAIELYNKVYGQTPTRWNELEIEEDKRFAKQCSLITVDEIINNNNKIPGNVDGLHTNENSSYWQEVKQEIEKL